MNKIKFDATVLSLTSNDYEYIQNQAENDVRKNMRSMLQSPTTPGILRGFTLESGYTAADMSLVRITHDILGTALNYLGTIIETSTGVNDLELLSSVLGIHTYFCISFSIVDASYDKTTQTIVVGEQKAVDLTDYSLEYNRSIETFEIVRYTAGQYAALTDEQLKNIICLGTAYRDNVDPLIASAITTTNRTDLKTFIADGSITIDQIDSSFLLPQINVDNSNTYNDAYTDTPTTLENDLNRLRTEIKDIKGTVGWETTASADLNAFDYKMNEVHYNGIFNSRDNFECITTSSGTAILLQSGKSLVEGRISTIEDDAELTFNLTASDRRTVGDVDTLTDGESIYFGAYADSQFLAHSPIDASTLRIFQQSDNVELYQGSDWIVNSSTGLITSTDPDLGSENVWAFYDWGYERYDVVEVTSTGTFRVTEGVAATNPIPPNTEGALRLYTLYRKPVTNILTNSDIKDSRNYVQKVRELYTVNADDSTNKFWTPYRLTYLTSTGYVDLNWDQWTISGTGVNSTATTTSNGAKIRTVIHLDANGELYVNLAKQIDGGTVTINYETVPGTGTLDGSSTIDFSSNIQMLNMTHLVTSNLTEGYHLVEIAVNNSNTTIINNLTFGKSSIKIISSGIQLDDLYVDNNTIINDTLYIDTINEKTTDNGIDIEGVHIENNAIRVNWLRPRKIGTDLNISTGEYRAMVAMNSTDIAYVDPNADLLTTYRFDGATWTLIGNTLDLTSVGGYSSMASLNNTDIALLNNNDDLLGTYNFDGTDWTLISNTLEIPSIGATSMAGMSSTSIAITGSNLQLQYCSFIDSNWTLIGDSLDLGGTGRASITALNSTDVAHINSSNESLGTYRFDGATWTLIGNELVIDASLTDASITALNQTDIVLIENQSQNLEIYRFDGVDWSLVSDTFNYGIGYEVSITALNGIDIVVMDGTDKDVRVYRFDYFISGHPYSPRHMDWT